MLLNVIADVVGSWWLALIFQTSHMITEVCSALLGVIAKSKSLYSTIRHPRGTKFVGNKPGAYLVSLNLCFV